MKHTYQIKGMTCNGCKTHVEQALSKVDGVASVSVDLKNSTAEIEMGAHIPLEKLQEGLKSSGGNYSISLPGDDMHQHDTMMHPLTTKLAHKQSTKGSGVFYCPMHCEGAKTYDKPGNCPVCGMDLVEQPAAKKATQYTCPMHPEIIRNEPGSCPICGMDLVPIKANVDDEDKTYTELLFKFKVAVIFTLPIFIIAMTEMIPRNPLFSLMPLQYWNWVELALSLPVVFYATWMFFQRAGRSII
ncbi:MAG: heavy metal-binding domain-containing protein, partial [Saprospiraceae bacterium]